MNHIQKLLLLQLFLVVAEMQISYFLEMMRLSLKKTEELDNLLTLLLQSNCADCNGVDADRFWVKPHQNSWWEFVVNGVNNESGPMSEQDFILNFRVTRQVFHEIVALLSPAITKVDTKFRRAISVEKRVAISLNVLSSCSELKSIANMFGVGLSTVHEIFDDFIDAAVNILVPQQIKWPTTTEDVKKKAKEFEIIKKFPMVVAAIDGCHIPITPPKVDATEYYNFKGWHSIVTMALCDAKGKVLYVKTGVPGKCHDSSIFKGTKLYRKIIEQRLFPQSDRIINGVKIPYLILGDNAFTLKPWLMKPYVHHGTLNQSQKVKPGLQ